MGMTWMNLQIKAKIENFPLEIIPEGYTARQTAGEWISVFETGEDYAWGKLCRLGREVSKLQETPVLAARLTDSDDFFMSLLMEGKTAASCQAGISRKYCSKITAWITGLGLTKAEASAFRYLLKKEMDAEDSMIAFSRLFGVCFSAQMKETKDGQGVWEKDAAGMIEEIEEEKKRRRIKNKTRATMIQEIPGIMVRCEERTGILQMVCPDETGNIRYGHIHCLEVCGDGLWEIHDFYYPEEMFGEDSRSLSMNYEYSTIKVYNHEGYSKTYYLQDWEEDLNAIMEIPAGKRRRKGDLAKFTSVFSKYEYVTEEGRYEYFLWKNPNGRKELRKADFGTSGKACWGKDIIAVYEYERKPSFDTAFWEAGDGTLVLTEDGIVSVMLQFMRENGNTLCDVRFFDKNLKIKRRVKIDLKERYKSMARTYCQETDCVYLGNKKIDLGTLEITAGIKELEEAERIFTHWTMEGKGFLYAVKGSYVYVCDLDLNLLSIHRLKGTIEYFYKTAEGKVRLITSDGWREKRGTAVRLYEISG